MLLVIARNFACLLSRILIWGGSGCLLARWAIGSCLGWLFLLACEAPNPPAPPIEVGFYHWQQRLELDSLPQCLLAATSSQVLPTKIMDIGWDGAGPALLFQLDVYQWPALTEDQPPFRLLPVVFITNQVMLKATKAELVQLTDDILQVAQRILPPVVWANINEWQFDCDWTTSSREAYFFFLEQMRQRLSAAQSMSATVRLHQYAHPKQQGVPPVDRGLLMVYNMGELNDQETINSILDTNISKQYLLSPHPYPLPLDIALPYYQWGAIYRDGNLVYLNNELTAADLVDTSRFKQLGATQFLVVRPTYLGTYYLYADDFIRLETVEEASLTSLAKQLQRIPAFTGQRLLFYHLGSQRAAACRLEELENILAIFNSR